MRTGPLCHSPLSKYSTAGFERTSISLTFLRTRQIAFLPCMLKMSLKKIHVDRFHVASPILPEPPKEEPKTPVRVFPTAWWLERHTGVVGRQAHELVTGGAEQRW